MSVSNFADHRAIKALERQFDQVEEQFREAKLAADPSLRERVLHLEIAAQRLRYGGLVALVRKPIIEMIELTMAAQETVGDPRDIWIALAFVLGDRGFVTDFDDRVAAHLKDLPKIYAIVEEGRLLDPLPEEAPT